MDPEMLGDEGSMKLPPSGRSSIPVAPAYEDVSTPHERLKLHLHFRSDILPDARNLIVYLPPQYAAEPERRFPVLYLHDGQNLFDPLTSFVPGRTWQVREAADEGIEAGAVEPLIIVGIYNTGDRRIAEYTPTRDWKMGGGEAPLYGRLIIEELMPFIARHYRTMSGPQHTGMGGSSLGGLVSLFLGIQCPDIFGRLAVHSPSVWWNHRSIMNHVRPAFGVERPRIWLDVGDSEGARTLDDCNRLHRQLQREGWRDDAESIDGDLHYFVSQGGRHDEAAWATRVGPMLRFLFPAG
jgi:enterochelin esterase-like enzyme